MYYGKRKVGRIAAYLNSQAIADSWDYNHNYGSAYWEVWRIYKLMANRKKRAPSWA